MNHSSDTQSPSYSAVLRTRSASRGPPALAMLARPAAARDAEVERPDTRAPGPGACGASKAPPPALRGADGALRAGRPQGTTRRRPGRSGIYAYPVPSRRQLQRRWPCASGPARDHAIVCTADHRAEQLPKNTSAAAPHWTTSRVQRSMSHPDSLSWGGGTLRASQAGRMLGPVWTLSPPAQRHIDTATRCRPARESFASWAYPHLAGSICHRGAHDLRGWRRHDSG